jgi:excisionase family DNA binding protein
MPTDTIDLQGAMTIADFCRRYRVGRTKVYYEIGEGRLRAVKLGAKTLIMNRDADAWARSLPELKAA